MVARQSQAGRSLLLLVGLVLLAVSCSTNSSDPAANGFSQTEPIRRVAEDTSYESTALLATLESEGVIYAAPLVIRGTVGNVEGPFWNTADGQKWSHRANETEEGPADYTTPEIYREVTVAVKDILRNDHDFEGDTVTLFALGAGKDSDDDNAFRDGHFEAGEDVILFIGPEAFWMRESGIVVYRPFYGYRAVYHVEDGRVIPDQVLAIRENIDPENPDAELPDPSNYPTVDEFVASITEARDVARSEFEAYRRPRGSAEAMRDAIEGIVADATEEE